MVTQNAEEIERLELRASEINQQIEIAEQMGMSEQVKPLIEEASGIENEIEELEEEEADDEDEEAEEEEAEEEEEEELMMMEDAEYEAEDEEEDEAEEFDAAEAKDQEEAMEAFEVLQQMAQRDPMDVSQYDDENLWDQVEERVENEYSDEARAANYETEFKAVERQGRDTNRQITTQIRNAWKT